MPTAPMLTMVYRPDDFDPATLTAATAVFAAAKEDGARNGFDFQLVSVGELVPGCTGRPRLWAAHPTRSAQVGGRPVEAG